LGFHGGDDLRRVFTMLRMVLILVCAVFCLSVHAVKAAPESEPSIADLYYSRYLLPLPSPLPDDGRFFQVTDPVIIIVQALYAAASNGLGWYAAGAEHLLMDPLVVGQERSFSVGAEPFGFWMITRFEGTHKCYSDPSANGGVDRLLVYGTPIPNEYFLAWEDCASTDGDYNDVILIGSHFSLTSAIEALSWGAVKSAFR
jgi:hypothetical protein